MIYGYIRTSRAAVDGLADMHPETQVRALVDAGVDPACIFQVHPPLPLAICGTPRSPVLVVPVMLVHAQRVVPAGHVQACVPWGRAVMLAPRASGCRSWKSPQVPGEGLRMSSPVFSGCPGRFGCGSAPVPGRDDGYRPGTRPRSRCRSTSWGRPRCKARVAGRISPALLTRRWSSKGNCSDLRGNEQPSAFQEGV